MTDHELDALMQRLLLDTTQLESVKRIVMENLLLN